MATARRSNLSSRRCGPTCTATASTPSGPGRTRTTRRSKRSRKSSHKWRGMIAAGARSPKYAAPDSARSYEDQRSPSPSPFPPRYGHTPAAPTAPLGSGLPGPHPRDGFEALAAYGYSPTRRQQREIERRVARSNSFADAWVSVFRADKFGEATTHWKKLEDRVVRGAGNPCPLLLIGLPAAVVVEHG